MIKNPVTVDLTTSFTEVVGGNDYMHGFAVYAIDSSDELVPWVLTTAVSGTEITIPAAAVGFDHIVNPHEPLFYAKTTAGTATLIVIVGEYNKS